MKKQYSQSKCLLCWCLGIEISLHCGVSNANTQTDLDMCANVYDGVIYKSNISTSYKI